jgi:hypothetical protein
MPLASTGADSFRRAHPTADGRGILIAILDTGIDPSAPGLSTTTTGERKILDLRDFSGEGAVPLTRVVPRGDTVEFAGRRLLGFGRVAALNSAGPYYGGVIAELPLGDPPAADLNGDGTADDTLPVIVTKASDGWVLFADTDGDGSLANEKPVYDFLQGYETFGWAPATCAGGRRREPSRSVDCRRSRSSWIPGITAPSCRASRHTTSTASRASRVRRARSDRPQDQRTTPRADPVTGNAPGDGLRDPPSGGGCLVINMSSSATIEGQARIDHLVDWSSAHGSGHRERGNDGRSPPWASRRPGAPSAW